jgi:Domain of unknown function (DUF4383)
MGHGFSNSPRRMRATQVYAALMVVFLGLRAVTTLAAGLDFHTPGTVWRAVLQLLICAALAWGLTRQGRELRAVIGVGVLYAVMTLMELVHGADLLGVVPVDARDRVVHPLLGLLAFAFAWVAVSRRPVAPTA